MLKATTKLSQSLEHPYRPYSLRFINWVGSTLRRIGGALAELSEESMLAAAVRETGLSDWGDERFRVALQILINSLETEANLNFFGRYLYQQDCIRLLSNRLRIQADLKRHPEILEVPIYRPLFITGLPRTGTTLLHNLLAQDQANRWLAFWELVSPSPPPERETRETDPRIEAGEKMVKKYNSLAPLLVTAHALNARAPEECNSLFEHDFFSVIFELSAHIPTYVEWMVAQNMIPPYQYYRQQLQLLSWKHPGERLLLKAPAHLFSLDALLTVFPDACIVQTHRNPLKVLPSICSLSAIARGIYTDRVDLKIVAQHWTNRLANAFEHGIKVRESAEPNRFFDVNYNTLVQDPIGTVRQIYEYFGYNYTPQTEESIKIWLRQNPQHKYGIHRYSLDEFGIDSSVVNQRFAKYRERFDSLID